MAAMVSREIALLPIAACSATHKAYQIGSDNPSFDLLVLDDLVNFLTEPAREVARQKTVYGDMG
jgi:hypothetical protein